MIVHAVVVARELAVAVSGDPGGLRSSPVPNIHSVDVPPPLIGCADECDALAVGRPARLDVHGAIAREWSDLPRGQIEQLELHRISVVAIEGHPPPIGRHVRLIVVAATRRQLRCDRRVERLLPQRAAHRVDQRAGIGHPRHATRTRRELRQVHLAEVVRVRHVDLLQHRLPLRGEWGRRTQARRERAGCVARESP